MKKLLFIANRLDAGGCEKQMLLAIEYFNNIPEYKCFLLVLESINSEFVKNNNVLSKISIFLNPFFANAKSKPQLLWSYFKAVSFIWRHNFELIIPYHRNTSFIFATVSFFTNSKCVFQERGGDLFATSQPKKILRYIFSSPKIIHIANSSHGGQRLAETLIIPQERVSVINNSIKPILVEPKWMYNSQKHVFVYIANFFPEKNHDFLLNCWLNYIKVTKTESKLCLIGRDGGNNVIQKYKDRVLDQEFDNTVEIIDTCNSPSEHLSSSTIGVFPSLSEGLPNVILEYVNHNIPIIASRIPAIIEILGNNYEYLFDPKDPIDFIDAIKRMTNHLSQQNRNQTYNRSMILDKYNIEKNMTAFRSLIEKI